MLKCDKASKQAQEKQMTLEALASNDFLNVIIYDTISATPNTSNNHASESNLLLKDGLESQEQQNSTVAMQETRKVEQTLGVQSRKKRKRRPRVCKNKEEAEAQRMTHITVERNRRKQMNEHLAVLRSLMPESYVQRGDQASIVGGAIEYVKELEHMLQTLEAKKLHLLQERLPNQEASSSTSTSEIIIKPPFAQFFVYPQYTWTNISNNKCSSNTKAAAIADIEVTLIESHASLRILSKRRPKQLSMLVAGFQALQLTVLHLNVTTMEPLVLYSISAKVEEGCQLTSVDDIAGTVHHMLRMMEQETGFCVHQVLLDTYKKSPLM